MMQGGTGVGCDMRGQSKKDHVRDGLEWSEVKACFAISFVLSFAVLCFCIIKVQKTNLNVLPNPGHGKLRFDLEP